MAWETSKNNGFLVTSEGRIVSFEPSREDSSGEMPEFLAYLLVVCVFGVFFGLIYWNSPWVQRRYAKLVGRGKKGA